MEKAKRVYSLGHEGSKPYIIRSILHENQITHLIDIRRRNEYRGSPFNQDRVRDLCNDAQVTYVHEPNLSPSPALLREESQKGKLIREMFPGRDKAHRLQRMKAFFEYTEKEFKGRYVEELEQSGGHKIFAGPLNEAERPCFFSKERYDKLSLSHRKMLLDHCLGRSGLDTKAIHLREWFYHTGRIHDLREAFDHVNRNHFGNKLKRSEVAFSWSTRLTGGAHKFIWGQFRAPNLILMNRKLDVSVVPEFFINGVFHHELIHYTRFRDGLDFRHTVDFYVEVLDFGESGKKFWYGKEFFDRHFPEIQEELELAKSGIEDVDKSMEPLFRYIDQIMTGKADSDGAD